MGRDDSIEVDGSDPVLAIDRTARTIVMAIDAAVKRLEELGYDRELDIRIIDPDSSFPGVTLDERYVFGIVTKVSAGRIIIDGEWLLPVRPLRDLGRLGRMRRRWRRWRRARAS